MKRATTFLAIWGLLSTAGQLSAWGAVIASESFVVGTGQYTTGNITGQNPSVAGFTGSWATNATETINVVTTGLQYPGLSSEGGAAQFSWSSDLSPRYAYRGLSSYDDTQTVYYLSGWMSFSDQFATDVNSYARMGFVNNNSVSPEEKETFGVQWGFRGNGSGVDAFLRVRDSGMNDYTILSNVTPGTHLFIVKIEPDTSALKDTVTVWFDPTDFSSEAAAGIFSWQRDSLVWVPGNPNYLVDTLVLRSYSVGANTIVGYDEARLGQTWADVVPAVPEPSSGILILLGFSALLGTAAVRRRFTRP